MNCRNCGAENEVGAVFCGNCGVIQSEENAVAPRVGPVGFSEAIQLAFQRWSDFKGRSTRAEYWWFLLFSFGRFLDLCFRDLGFCMLIGVAAPSCTDVALYLSALRFRSLPGIEV